MKNLKKVLDFSIFKENSFRFLAIYSQPKKKKKRLVTAGTTRK
jgi:hypothetical protein